MSFAHSVIPSLHTLSFAHLVSVVEQTRTNNGEVCQLCVSDRSVLGLSN